MKDIIRNEKPKHKQWRISTVCTQIKNELSLGDKNDLHWKNLTTDPYEQPEKPKLYKPNLTIHT
jgi:hypothetical protein